jgi:ABC-type multidrug transport system fused ATPase/permease subunit
MELLFLLLVISVFARGVRFFQLYCQSVICQAQILLRKRKFSGILELLVGGVFNFLGRTQSGRLHSQQCAAAAVA